ncbi:MAG: signal peptidase I [Candidatus Dormibacteria bacterium]
MPIDPPATPVQPQAPGERETSPSGDQGRRALLRDLLEVVALAAVIYLLIAFAIQPVHVEGTSMYPGLHNNDLLITEKISLDFSGPARGQIVVINPPIASPNDFIKRVIGLPGEWIRIAPNSQGVGHVYISNSKPTSASGGRQLVEPYINGVWTQQVLCCTTAGTASPALPATGSWAHIPRNEYFVMGDNRNFSEDSRTFGWEPRRGVQAIAILRFWPPTRLALLPAQTPTVAAVGAVGLALPVQRRRRVKGRSRKSRRAPS